MMDLNWSSQQSAPCCVCVLKAKNIYIWLSVLQRSPQPPQTFEHMASVLPISFFPKYVHYLSSEKTCSQHSPLSENIFPLPRPNHEGLSLDTHSMICAHSLSIHAFQFSHHLGEKVLHFWKKKKKKVIGQKCCNSRPTKIIRS